MPSPALLPVLRRFLLGTSANPGLMGDNPIEKPPPIVPGAAPGESGKGYEKWPDCAESLWDIGCCVFCDEREDEGGIVDVARGRGRRGASGDDAS